MASTTLCDLILITLHQLLVIQVQVPAHGRHQSHEFLFADLHRPADEPPGTGVERARFDQVLAAQDQTAALRPAQAFSAAKERQDLPPSP